MSEPLAVEAMDASQAGSLPFDEQAALDVVAGRRTAVRFVSPDAPGDGLVGHGVLGAGALDLAILPELRARGWGRRAAEELLALAGAGELTAWSHGDHPAARALAAAHGFAPARQLLRLRRHVNGVPPAPVLGADGARFAAFRPGVDEDAWLAVNARAFAWHPEQGALTAQDLSERMAEPWFDPAGFLLAHDAVGRLLGFCWTKVEPGSADGEIYVIGVDPDAEGRGLGRALLRAGIAHLSGLGVARIELYTEAGNARALAIYRAAGFELVETHVQYRRPASTVPLA